MSSPYNHHKFTSFTKVNVADYAIKKRGFLASLDNGYILDNNLLLNKLVSYYSDLNEVLRRLSSGYHDYMFMRFAYKTKMFYYSDRFHNILELWDDAFSFALESYMKDRHYKFVETYGISYVAYFDINFSNALYYALVDLEYKQKYNSRSNEELYSEIDDISRYLTDEPIECPRDFAQELVSHSFAPSLLTIL